MNTVLRSKEEVTAPWSASWFGLLTSPLSLKDIIPKGTTIAMIEGIIKFITIKIIKKYLSLDYYFFLKNKNSKLISNLYNECKAFVEWFISPLIVILSEFETIENKT